MHLTFKEEFKEGIAHIMLKHRISLRFLFVGLLAACILISCNASYINHIPPPIAKEPYYINATLAKCAISPYNLFRSGMVVLQREKIVPVWETADHSLEGKELKVSFAGQSKQVTTTPP